MNIFCENCGNKIEEDSKFCIECGTEINSTPNVKKENPVINNQKSNDNKSIFFNKKIIKNIKLSTLLPLSIIFILVIGIVLCIVTNNWGLFGIWLFCIPIMIGTYLVMILPLSSMYKKVSLTMKNKWRDKETKQACIILGCIALAVVLFFSGRTIYMVYKSQQQQTQTLIQQQQEALNTANQQIKDAQTKADEETQKLQNQVTTLQNKKPETIIKEVPAPASLSDADIISEWKNRVAEVTCWWNYSDGTNYETDGGSATLVNLTDHGVTAVTNKHVLSDTTSTYAPNTCLVGVYGNGARAVNYISPGNPFGDGTGDWGYIYLNNSDKPTDNGAFDTIVSSHLNICQESQVALGDQIVILGYPAIGTTNGITATEGIISGLESDYYVTSTKIDHGNSGGAAILVKNDCWLGMPTSAITGSIESLGRILKAKFVLGN